MEQLTGLKVKHGVFGEGTVKEHKGGYIVIAFPQGDKEFNYPDAFTTFLSAADPIGAATVAADLDVMEAQKVASSNAAKKQQFMRRMQQMREKNS